MEVEYIIDGLNQYWSAQQGGVKGRFIVQKSIDSVTGVKSLKQYRAQVWFKEDNAVQTKPTLAFSAEISTMIHSDSDKEKAESQLLVALTNSMLVYLATPKITIN